MTAIDLMLGENMVSCRGTSSDANQTIAGLAESGGSVEVECYLNTAKTMGECAGTQMMPMYANGSYALGAQITTDEGNKRQSLATQQVTLSNTGHVVVMHSGGMSLNSGGNMVYGGPTSDDNMNSFSACPVSFKGTTVGELTLSADMGLKFGKTDKAAKTTASATMTFKAPPFTAMVYSSENATVGASGAAMVTVTNSGAIMDGDGLTVTDEFRMGAGASAMAYFDFAAPTTDAVMINKSAIAAGTHYSGAKANAFSTTATDMGVGVKMTQISVGDCTVNKFDKDGKRGAFMPLAGYENVMAVSELAEEDAAMGGDKDTMGNDCYVAQVTASTDKLGNATMIGTTSATANQSANFGVDMTAPVIEDIEFDGSKAFNTNTTIKFEIENPKLASGDAGTSVLAKNATVTIPDGKDADKDPDPAGSVAFDLASDDDATATVALPADGTHTVTVTVKDGAMPPNMASFARTLTYDTTDPTFSGSGPTSTLTGGHTAAIAVSGVVKDATAGLKTYTLSIRNNATDSDRSDFFCEAADPALDKDRWKDVEVKGGNAKSMDIGRTLSLKRPAGAGAPDSNEKLCVLLTATDAAGSGNSKDFSVATFEVDWSAVAAVVVENAPTTAIAEGSSSESFTVKLSERPTDTVYVAVGGAGKGITVDTDTSTDGTQTAPLKFAPDNYETAQTVGLISATDDNIVSESVTLTTTASGGGYDGVTGTPVKVTANDPDVSFTPTSASINEGVTDTLSVTVTRTAAGESALSLTVAEGTDADDAIESVTVVGTAEIPANMASATIKIEINAADTIAGTADKTVAVTIVPDGGRGLPVAGISVTIVNDDA